MAYKLSFLPSLSPVPQPGLCEFYRLWRSFLSLLRERNHREQDLLETTFSREQDAEGLVRRLCSHFVDLTSNMTSSNQSVATNFLHGCNDVSAVLY